MSLHHSIDYIEFEVTDLAEAKAFYSKVFGWEFKDYGPKYAGIVGNARERGGMEEVDIMRPIGGPLVVLYSNDLEKTREAITENGGTIELEAFDFPGGRRFHFSDPSGNVLGVWTTR